MRWVAWSKSFARILLIPHNQSAHLSTQSPFYKHYPRSSSTHNPSFLPRYTCPEFPELSLSPDEIHKEPVPFLFSSSPIQCRSSWYNRFSQTFSVPRSSSRQYHNQQNQNHVSNFSNPLSPHCEWLDFDPYCYFCLPRLSVRSIQRNHLLGMIILVIQIIIIKLEVIFLSLLSYSVKSVGCLLTFSFLVIFLLTNWINTIIFAWLLHGILHKKWRGTQSKCCYSSPSLNNHFQNSIFMITIILSLSTPISRKTGNRVSRSLWNTHGIIGGMHTINTK